MGVYIKGLELPTDCLSCPFTEKDDRMGTVCYFTNIVALNIGRQKDCPLIEVPKHHGRLIDGDKLFDDEKLCYGVSCGECQFLYKTENFLESCCKVEHMIYNAPTVIEGSK